VPVWAPQASAVSLHLPADHEVIPMKARDDGWWESPRPLPAGTDYAYRLDDGLDDSGEHRGGDDADEDGALHPAHVQDEHEEQAEEEDEHGPSLKGPAQPQLERSAAGADHLGVHQADQGDEQADADADRGLDMGGDRSEDGLAETGEHQDEDDDALDDDEPHGVGVGHAIHADERVGDHRVDAQPRRQSHGVIGDHPHEDGYDPGDQGGAGGDLLGGAQRGDAVVRGGQDERVQHEDVGHREEGDDAAANLAGERRAALGDVEEGVEGGAAGGRRPGGGGVRTHSVILPDGIGWRSPRSSRGHLDPTTRAPLPHAARVAPGHRASPCLYGAASACGTGRPTPPGRAARLRGRVGTPPGWAGARRRGRLAP